MIYYPLSMLMLASIRDILVISTPEDIPAFKRLLRDGSQWGLKFRFAEQANPNGLPEAFIIGEEFIGNDKVSLILGDNIFYGTGLQPTLQEASKMSSGAVIFAYTVRDPRPYAVAEIDADDKVLSLEEKPEHPRSNFAVPGIYFYDNRVIEMAKSLKPSKRGELEITDLNRRYMELNDLRVKVLGRGIAWLDAGTHEFLLQAANFVQAIEDRQGLMIACPEEIAFRMGYIQRQQLCALAAEMANNNYGNYLKRLAEENL